MSDNLEGSYNEYIKRIAQTKDKIHEENTKLALHKSEAHYRDVFNNPFVGFALCKIVTDNDEKPTDYIFLEVNNAFEKFTGLTKENIINRKVTEIFPPEEIADIIQIYGKVALTGESTRFETYMPTLDKFYDIEAFSTLRGEFTAFFNDITDYKKTEEKIQRLADVVESSSDAIITKSLEGIILSWNKGAEQIYGYPTHEILEKPISILEPAQISGETKKLINKIKNGENVHHYETIRLKKNGELINVSVTLSPVFNTSEELIAVSTIARDITEHKLAEEEKEKLLEQTQLFAEELEALNEELRVTTEELQVSNEELRTTTEELQITNEKLWQQGGDLARVNQALRESDKRMNRSQEIAHIGSWELDLVNNQLYWSDEVYGIFGLQPQEFGATYEAFLEAIHPDDREAVDEAYSGSVREGRDIYEIEHRVVRKSTGEVRFVHEKCEHFRNVSGEIIRSVGMVHDITERKQAENALIKSNERFKLLSDAASTILSSETPEKIVETICQKVMKYLDCQVFFNYFLDEKKQRLHLNAYTGIPEETRKPIEWLELGVAICGCVARDSCRIVAENIQETLDERAELVKSLGIKAYACHPIISKGHTIGTLSFGTKSRSYFEGDELELMRTVTDYVATAMERKIREEAVIQAKEDWEKTFDAVQDLIVLLDRDHRVIRANKAMAERLGMTPEECIGLPCYSAVHGTDEPPLFCPHSVLLEDGLEHTMEVHEDNLGGDFIVSVSPIHDSNSKLIGSVHVAHDITGRKKAEEQKQKLLDQTQQLAEELEVSNEELRATTEELQDQRDDLKRLNRVLRALGDSDYAMMHAENENEYLNEVCRIIIEVCDHAMVWIGFAEENESKTVRPVAQYGFDEGYIENLNITWADTERGRGPTGTAIRTGKPCGCSNMLSDPNFEPWKEEAIKRGYASSIVLPLITDNKTLGAISIYAREPDSFLEDEIKLLGELANDLAFGIKNLRLRAENERAEKELRESEQKLRTLFEISPVGISIIDKNRNVVYQNPALERILNVSEKELMEKSYEKRQYIRSDGTLMPHEEIPSVRALKENRAIENVEIGITKEDKSIIWTNVSATPLSFSDWKALIVTSDITERKKLENELRESEERYRLILETANSGVFLIDSKNKVKYHNQRMEEILGYTSNEMLDSDITQFMDLKGQKNILKFMEHWKKGASGLNEFKFIRKDGSTFWTLLAASPIADNNGSYIGTIGVITDINARKGVEKALMERERVSKAILYDMMGMINKLMKEESKNEYSEDFEKKYEYT